jgi:dynein heavy chain
MEDYIGDLYLSKLTEKGIINFCVFVHMTMKQTATEYLHDLGRSYYLDDTKFVELLGVFQRHLKKRRKEIDLQSSRLNSGLEKLSSVRNLVTNLSADLEAKIPILNKTSEDIAALLTELAERRLEVKRNMEIVQEEERLAREKEGEARQLREQAEAELSTALPALEEADKALKRLKRKDINELKSFTNPPPGLTVLLEAVCIMFGRKPKKVEGPNNTRYEHADTWRLC